MDELTAAISEAFHEGTYKCVLSAPVSTEAKFRKSELTRKEEGFQLERFTQTQAFHENLSFAQAREYLLSALESDFRQYNGWDEVWEYAVKVSKKGRVLRSRSRQAGRPPKAESSHNREKRYLLAQGEAIPPLVDMGIFTQEGKVVKAMYGKYRQINRFVEIVDDAVKNLDSSKPLTTLDFGCGKSYLTFILYHYFTAIRGIKLQMTGLDLKADVIANCQASADRYGYGGLRFEVGDIGGYVPPAPPDLVISLHACDTATDHALYSAIRWNTKMIFAAPCCQHELDGQISGGSLPLLTRYGVVRERIAALMTDAIRCSLLEYCGYKTQMVEFVAFDHTPKNIMIRAVKRKSAPNPNALAEVEALMKEFSLDPMLYRLLRAGGYL